MESVGECGERKKPVRHEDVEVHRNLIMKDLGGPGKELHCA